jgi:hypothetical protein
MEQWLKGFQRARAVPRLWVETVWLVESREPLVLTRAVKLHQGLNIVWAKESVNDASPGLSSAGHGVGKTSLCLLLRHVLGDDAQAAISTLRDKAVSSFPKGGVGARVHVDGTSWVVFRPYGAHGHSLAVPADSLEALFLASQTNGFQAYLAALEESSIGRLSTQFLPGTSQPLKWRHLLAWCTRDQRTRFDGFYHWREGEGLGFAKPRRDPPVFVSSVLGLVDAELNKLMQSVEAKQTEVDSAEASIPELEREPVLMLSNALRQLRMRVKATNDEPIFKTTVGESIESRVAVVLDAAAEHEAILERQSEDVEGRVIEDLALSKELHRQLSLAEAEFGIAKARDELNQADLNRFIKMREDLQNPTGRCDIGNVEWSDCQHVQERRSKVDLMWVKDEREVKLKVGDHAAQLTYWTREVGVAAGLFTAQEARVSNSRAEVRRLRMRFATSETSCATLKESWDDLRLRQEQRVNGGGTAELIQAREKLGISKAALDSLKASLAARKLQHSARTESLKALTAVVGERMLGAKGHARFVPGHEFRPFEVAKGGEAYQVLEVLLGDMVCLIDAATSEESRHPGFLVHDCPREADMSEHLYRRFFLTAAEAASQLSDAGNVPFQFIVTTTSPPPSELQSDNYVVLELEPGVEQKLLFTRELMPTLPGFELQ